MKTEIKGLDLTLTKEVLDNGLTVYLLPKNDITSIYATFTAKFGGNDTCFISKGENDFIKVPDGIAHFLEHKMFEQESGIDVASAFSKNGVSSNASTSNFRTSYLFDGSSKFYENLDLLLNYVQEPYYTDSNVEKEKHIIEQEIDMYADNPYKASFLTMLKNIFVVDPSRVPVIGSKESVRSITKEDLYKCYNTFYDPHNMILVITGNIDVDETLAKIRENQSKKTFDNYEGYTLKKYDEPLEVSSPYEELFMNITVPKLSLGFKISINDLKEKFDIPLVTMKRYLNMFGSIRYGNVSLFVEDLRKKEIITSTIDHGLFSTDDYIIFVLDTDSKNPEQVIESIKEDLKNKEVDEKLFNLKKKGMVASTVYMSENIYSMNSKIVNDYIFEGEVETDVLDNLKGLNYLEFKKFVEELDFSNSSIVVVKPM